MSCEVALVLVRRQQERETVGKNLDCGNQARHKQGSTRRLRTGLFELLQCTQGHGNFHFHKRARCTHTENLVSVRITKQRRKSFS
jgi:hypothetical protein